MFSLYKSSLCWKQIRIFIVYKAPDVQSTNVKIESSVTVICLAIYVIVLCETRCNPDEPR